MFCSPVWYNEKKKKTIRKTIGLSVIQQIQKGDVKMNRERKTDRRTVYTKRVIREAFMNALRKKNYDKITVSEICAAAEINRSTFYLHYETVLTVFDELLDEVLAEMMPVDRDYSAVSLPELFSLGTLAQSRAMGNRDQALLLTRGFTYPAFIERYSEEAAKAILPFLQGSPELSEEQRLEIIKGLFYADAMLNKAYAEKHRTKDLSAYSELINRYILMPAMEKLK